MIGKFSILGKYFISTRLKSKGNKVAFLLFYLFPMVLLTYSYSSNYVYDLCKMLVMIGLTYSIYESGYIYNDTITIRKEIEPTLRLSQRELSFFSLHVSKILTIRVITFVILMMLYLALGVSVIVLILLFLLFVIFYTYNNVRSKLNLFLHFVLVSLRYLIPLIPIFGEAGYVGLLLVLVLYPILNSLERAPEKRFSYISANFFLVDHKKNGRIYYYTIALFLSSAYYYLFNAELFPFVIVFSVMLFARVMAGIIVKYRKNYEY